MTIFVTVSRVAFVAGARRKRAKGKAVKIGRGRAAVTGDDRREMPLFRCVIGMGRCGGRMTRKPEDLPATNLV